VCFCTGIFPSQGKNYLDACILFILLKFCPCLEKLFPKTAGLIPICLNRFRNFPDGNDFLNVLKEAGFKNCVSNPLTMGIASIYKAQKIEN
jgi:demethylmenaquinone methyltransferase / 2-methoxy-6-polyprenyl-1,4-benzoquinol methylase